HPLPVIAEARAPVANIRNVHPHVVRDLTFQRDRPVLIARECQVVLRHSHRTRSVCNGRIDERRELDTGTAAERRILREALVQEEGRTLPVVWRLNERIGRKSDRGVSHELREGHAGIVDSIAPANGSLVARAISETKPRAEVVDPWVFKRARSGTARARACEDHGAWDSASTRIGSVRIEGGILVVHLGSRGLVIPAQAQSQCQPGVNLPLIVDPRSIVRLVTRRMHGNGLVRVVHLSEEHRSERVARISRKNIAVLVITGGLKVVKNEMTAYVTDAPTDVRELVPAILKPNLNRVFSSLP